MISLNKAVVVLTAALLAPAAHAAIEDTVAVVNGKPIMLSEYQKELSSSMEYWAHSEPDALRDPANVKKLKDTTLDELINRELLYQQGVKLGIKIRQRDIDTGVAEIKSRFTKDDNGNELTEEQAQAAFEKQLHSDGLTYDQFRHRLAKQIMARKLIDQEVRPRVPPPTDKEIHAYFDKIKAYIASGSTQAPAGMNPDEAMAFQQIAGQIKAMTSEGVRVQRILIKISPNASPNEKKRAYDAAMDVRKKLLAGADFSELAKKVSEDPISAPNGGDIGWVVRGVSPPDFEKAVFALPVGDISEPITTEIGYNIVRVTEKRAAEDPEYDKFRDDLGKYLLNIKFQHQLESYVKQLKAQAVISKNLSAIE